MKANAFEDGKFRLLRSPDERKPLIERLNRIEGQVRGLKLMIENDRYCGDELQQIKAAIAALRRVAIMISEQHVSAAAERLGDSKVRATASKDITRILSEVLEI